MSYFEPSRQPFERRRIGSLTSALDAIFRQPLWWQVAATLGLAAYVGIAAALCGLAWPTSAATGMAITLALVLLLALYRRSWPGLSGVAFVLILGVGGLALLLPAIVYIGLGFWLLVSLPLWLFRG